ncbi:hypothetical protein AX16_003794 [Volvariella volvacea WC 439]|nr:hypothetical protein AX16_003794 [Volvariella volvacea WC 439]
MGNAQSGTALTRTTGALDSFVSELGSDIIHEKSLGTSRFLKTVKCRHRNGYLVIKIFIKPDPGFPLRNYIKRLKSDREALVDLANVYNYQSFVETDKAGYIIRQWIASNLYDRISTRPFLSPIEKKWIAFQILNGLRDARNRKVAHGDIKCENILVTSWNWVYISDFASTKPTYLPLDDPADFSYFFDTSGRRTCYIAPERFYTVVDNPEISARKSRLAMEELNAQRDGKVTEAMDVFSAGCVIAELFLEVAPLFTLSQLFKYREGEYNVDAQLTSIEDGGVRNLIKQMINLNPDARPTFDTLLHTSRGTVFPETFYSFLHNYISTLNELPSNSPISTSQTLSAPSSAAPSTTTPSISSTALRPSTSTGHQLQNVTNAENTDDLIPSDSDNRIEQIWADYESMEPYLTVEPVEEESPQREFSLAGPSRPFQDVFPVELHIPNRDSKIHGATRPGTWAAKEDGPALVILALVTANVRNCSLPSSKLRALDVFLALCVHLTDEAKLDRMVPYIVDLLHDEAPVVRASALRTLVQVLMLVTVITPSNAAIFPEYIIPNIKHLVLDPEVSVRCMYAQCITQIAETAARYLEMGQALKAHGTFKLSAEGQEAEHAGYEVSYDVSLQDLQLNIQEHLSALLVDNSSIVKRAVLHDISGLCIFLGRQRTNDVLLSHMITYLNDRDWMLRYAFFESIVDVAACAGRDLEDYIVPLMSQALSDVEEHVVAKVLRALTSLCELGLFQKMRIWELMGSTLGFLYHPNIWIRQGAAAFIVAAAKQLPTADVWCILYPSLRHYLRSDIAEIDEASLLTAMKTPLPRQLLDTALQRGDKTSFWRSLKDHMATLRKTGSVIAKAKSEEDEAQIAKLQQLGMTPSEANKLLAMREYIMKLAEATTNSASRIVVEPEAEKNLKQLGNLELQKLGVVPQTVFLRSKTSTTSGSAFTGSAIEGSSSSRTPRLGSGLIHHHPRSAGTASNARSPLLSPRSSRVTSLDTASMQTAPFEDLRRRLASINSSVSSLGPGTSSSPSASGPITGGAGPSPRSGLSQSPVVFPVAPGSSSPSHNAPITPTTPTQSSHVPSALSSPLPHTLPTPTSVTTTMAIPTITSNDLTTTTPITPLTYDRPASPTESIVSTTASVNFRPLSRLQIGSVLDGQKTVPLIGSSKANATGVLEAHSKMSVIGQEDISGRSSPAMSQTVRPGQYGHGLGLGPVGRSRAPSVLPISTYDGSEQGISNILENLYLDNNRDLQNDFGPRVHEGPVRRRNVRHTNPPSTSGGSSRGNKTDATLIAHLTSHTDCVTGLAVSPDHMFFVSCSDDKTVKIWDTARLERNVTSKPRLTYSHHHARVKCVCILEGVHCFASAADDGSLHVVRVTTSHTGQMGVAGLGLGSTAGGGPAGALPKYSKLNLVREHRMQNVGEYVTCMTHFNTESASNLVYATTHSNIVILDLRTMKVVQAMENPRHFGPITCMCMDRKRTWLVVGTSAGVLTLWDRRFGILIKSWHAGATTAGRTARIHQIALHPSKGKGKWIMVALEASKRHSPYAQQSMSPSASSATFVDRQGPGTNANANAGASGATGTVNANSAGTTLIEVWDIEETALVETYVTRTMTNQVNAIPSTNGTATSMVATTSQVSPPTPEPTIPEPQKIVGIEADSSPAAAIAALVRSRQGIINPHDKRQRMDSRSSISSGNSGTNGVGGAGAVGMSNRTGDALLPTPAPDVRTMVVGLDFGGYHAHRPEFVDMGESSAGSGAGGSSRHPARGFVVTGSDDRKLRLWDIGRVERTAVLSGLESDQDRPSYSTSSSEGAATHVEMWLPNTGQVNRAPQRWSLINNNQENLLKSHQDIITALACIDAPFRGGIVSGDRAGVIKVWRVEYGD